MTETSTELTKEMRAEDTLHRGATRPVMIRGLPIHLAVALGAVAYAIQITITGINGFIWAGAIVGPCWFISGHLIAHDPYGINVAVAWIRNCMLCLDRRKWGGISCAPIPVSHDRTLARKRISSS
jgi:type IV secretory pathway VirB3-like protein